MSCAPTINSSEIHEASTYVACNAFGPITWSKHDTDVTINEVKNHNETFAKVCAK